MFASTITNINSLWTEKYRPKVLDDLLADKKTKSYFITVKETKDIQHILLTGRPGCGKTTLAKIIAIDLLDWDYLYFNASDENGIETIRLKISQFVMTKSRNGRRKLVIPDEIDGMSAQAQRALRNLMEEYSQYARFILTGNEKHKIIPALQSRCESFELNYTLQDIGQHCKKILDNENIALDTPEQKKKFCEIIKNGNGDIRKTINDLQTHCITGKFIVDTDDSTNFDELIDEIYKLILQKDPLSIRQLVIDKESSFNNDYISLMKRLIDYIFENTTISQSTKVQYLKTLTEYYYRTNIVADQEINWFSCILNLVC